MKTSRKAFLGIEGMVLLCLLIALVVSLVAVGRQVVSGKARLAARAWASPSRERPAEALDFGALERAVAATERPVQSDASHLGLLVSELRVVAIGSAYPIPYEAEVCPYSNIPQPAMNQLDRDGDGITDDWELKYGLDKYNVADALTDLDGDGFTNLEEFRFKSDPRDAGSHPPYALKLRFVKRRDIPFPAVFQGESELPDGKLVFQINTPSDGNTYFKMVGEDLGEGLRDEIHEDLKSALKGIVVQRFIPGQAFGETGRLVVRRGESEIVLEKGKTTADPESEVELINILDRTPIIATMGALLSLHSDEYTVLSVHPDKVVVKHLETEEVFDIVGLAEGGLGGSPEDLE